MKVDARDLVSGALISMLNRSLDAQGISDVRVLSLSRDFKVARVSHIYKDGRRVTGAVMAQSILPTRP